MEDVKKVVLEDNVDFDALANLLLEDRFESITEWDEISGNGRISREYAGNEEQLTENMKASDFDYSNHYSECFFGGFFVKTRK